MYEVPVTPRASDGYESVLEPDDYSRLQASLERLRSAVGACRVWHVNSTAEGGGVAELLSTLLPYQVGAGIDAHWLVIEGSDEFFDITKRLHNWLHGEARDDADLSEAHRSSYERTLASEGEDLADLVQRGDIVVLHDPQVAGLVPRVRERGAHALWRCHIGADQTTAEADRARRFLLADVCGAEAVVFSRRAHVWPSLNGTDVSIIPPCIDVLSPKNRTMLPDTVLAILGASGAMPEARAHKDATFVDRDDVARVVTNRVDLVEEERLTNDTAIVLQVSRWDRLKDPKGLMDVFALEGDQCADAHLVLAGPAEDGVADDPESAAVLGDLTREWERLPGAVRRRVHLLSVPVEDADENAAIVNALQRRADVVVQKSLAEGFGLTVAEAMWKSRPVVASKVGGIQDQIDDGETGVLIDDPEDAVAFARAIGGLLDDGGRAAQMGKAAHRRVCDHLLPLHDFELEAALFEGVLGA